MTYTVWSYPFSRPDRLRLDPRYAYLRANQPVARVRMPYGDPAWLVTGYHNARTVLAGPQFSRAHGRDEPRTSENPLHFGFLSFDPPEHTRLRRTVSSWFTALRVAQWRARVEQIAEDLVDAMVRTGPPVDFVQFFARPLPITSVAEMLGVPVPTDRRFASWSQVMVNVTKYTAAQVHECNTRLGMYMRGVVKARRRYGAAGSGLLDGLIHARDQGDRLTEEELIWLGVIMLSMAHENTTTQLTNFAYTLMTQRDAWEQLCGEPELVPTAVEELVRYIPITPFAEFPRYVTENVELDGAVLRSGDAVLVALTAADRDEQVFSDPDRLDLRRHPNPHLGFSHGIHHCLGAPLARMELQVCLSTLTRRLPTLKLATDEDQIPWKSGLLVRGPEALPVTW